MSGYGKKQQDWCFLHLFLSHNTYTVHQDLYHRSMGEVGCYTGEMYIVSGGYHCKAGQNSKGVCFLAKLFLCHCFLFVRPF